MILNAVGHRDLTTAKVFRGRRGMRRDGKLASSYLAVQPTWRSEKSDERFSHTQFHDRSERT